MKNSHLSKYKLTAFALTALIFIPFMSSSGWATIIEGNLEVKAGAGANSSNGDVTVEGATSLKGDATLGDSANDTTTIEGPINANNTLTVSGAATLNGSTTLGNEDTDIITVKGALKIESVDSSSDGISTNMTSTQNNTTIPTTQAVSSYVGNIFKIVLSDENFGFCASDNTTTGCTLGNGRKTKTINVEKPVTYCLVGASASSSDPSSPDRFAVEGFAGKSADQKVDVTVRRTNGMHWGGNVLVSGTLYCYKW